MTTTVDVQAVRPVERAERLDVLDVIRGVAVFGILLMNIVPFSGAMMFNPGDAASLPGARFDRASAFFLELAAHAKFYSLFSLLFGVGFAMFLDRAAARGADPARLFRRRLTGLLIIGLIHTIFIWFGDILNVYAVLGFLLLPFRRAANRTLLLWAAAACASPIVICGLALLAAIAAGVRPDAPAGEAGGLPPILVDAIRAFAGGSYLDVLRGNLVFTAAGWARRILTMFLPRMFGMFLFGVWAHRVGIFREPSRHRGLLQRICLWSLAIGLPASAAGAAMGDVGIQLVPDLRGFVWTVLLCAGSTGLCFFYASGLVLLFERAGWRERLLVLAPVGAAALSNYLLQSVLAIVVFYGIGFGWYGHVSTIVALAIAAAMFVVQIALSHAWLSRAAYGPVEWLWRQFTYGRRMPLWRRSA